MSDYHAEAPHTVTGPPDEALLGALRDTGLTAHPDNGMDWLAQQVASVLRVPVALVSLVEPDRHVFPGLVGARRAVAEQFGVRRRFGPVPIKRHTFFIGQDREVIEVIKSEFSMNSHADEALAALRGR